MADSQISDNPADLVLNPQDLTRKVINNLSILQAISNTQIDPRSQITVTSAIRQQFPKSVLRIISYSQLNPTTFQSSTSEHLEEYSLGMSDQGDPEMDPPQDSAQVLQCDQCGAHSEGCTCDVPPSETRSIQPSLRVSPVSITEEEDKDISQSNLESPDPPVSMKDQESERPASPGAILAEFLESNTFLKAMSNQLSSIAEKAAGMYPEMKLTGAPKMPAFSKKTGEGTMSRGPPEPTLASPMARKTQEEAAVLQPTTTKTNVPPEPTESQLDPDAPPFTQQFDDAEINRDFRAMIEQQEEGGKYEEWILRKVQWGYLTEYALESKDPVVQELCHNAFDIECMIDRTDEMAHRGQTALEPQDLDGAMVREGKSIYHQIAYLNLTLANIIDNQNGLAGDLIRHKTLVDERLRSIEATIQSKFDQVIKAIQGITSSGTRNAPPAHQEVSVCKPQAQPSSSKVGTKKGKPQVTPQVAFAGLPPHDKAPPVPPPKVAKALPVRRLTEKQWEYTKRCQKAGFTLDEIKAHEAASQATTERGVPAQKLSTAHPSHFPPELTQSGPKIPATVKSSLAKVDPVVSKHGKISTSGELAKELDHVIRRFESRDKNPLYGLLTKIKSTYVLQLDPSVNLRDYNPADLLEYSKELREYLRGGGKLEPLVSQG